MSAEWAARDKQPILQTSTNPCITRAAGTQRVKVTCAWQKSGHEIHGSPVVLDFRMDYRILRQLSTVLC